MGKEIFFSSWTWLDIIRDSWRGDWCFCVSHILSSNTKVLWKIPEWLEKKITKKDLLHGFDKKKKNSPKVTFLVVLNIFAWYLPHPSHWTDKHECMSTHIWISDAGSNCKNCKTVRSLYHSLFALLRDTVLWFLVIISCKYCTVCRKHA